MHLIIDTDKEPFIRIITPYGSLPVDLDTAAYFGLTEGKVVGNLIAYEVVVCMTNRSGFYMDGRPIPRRQAPGTIP